MSGAGPEAEGEELDQDLWAVAGSKAGHPGSRRESVGGSGLTTARFCTDSPSELGGLVGWGGEESGGGMAVACKGHRGCWEPGASQALVMGAQSGGSDMGRGFGGERRWLH